MVYLVLDTDLGYYITCRAGPRHVAFVFGGSVMWQRPFDKVDRDLVPAIRVTNRAQRAYPPAAYAQRGPSSGSGANACGSDERETRERILSRFDLFAPPLRICEAGQNRAAVPHLAGSVPHLAGDPGSNRARPPFVMFAPV
jgi:hypothetical protein